jgi:hypothetical protein
MTAAIHLRGMRAVGILATLSRSDPEPTRLERRPA